MMQFDYYFFERRFRKAIEAEKLIGKYLTDSVDIFVSMSTKTDRVGFLYFNDITFKVVLVDG